MDSFFYFPSKGTFMGMKHLSIIYHSQSGSTACLADAVYQGALSEEGVSVSLLRAMEAEADDLAKSDGVIFGSPENFGYLSGGLKDFFDRSFYPLESQQLNIPYGVVISAGNDGSGAVRQLERIVCGYPLKKVSDPVIVKGLPHKKDIEACHAFGAMFAAALAMGVY